MTFLSKYLNTSEDNYNSDILEVNNIQTGRAYAFAIPLICTLLSPLPFAAGMFNWQIDLTIIVTCFLILFHTIVTYRYSDVNFYITDIKINDNKILRLEKNMSGVVNASFYGEHVFLRKYNISDIDSVQLFVEKVSSNFNLKRPLLLQNEDIRIILIINQNEKQDKFIIYFKSNEDNYQKISSIIKLLSTMKTFKYDFVNINKSLFKNIK